MKKLILLIGIISLFACQRQAIDDYEGYMVIEKRRSGTIGGLSLIVKKGEKIEHVRTYTYYWYKYMEGDTIKESHD